MILARGNIATCVIGYAASMGAIIAQAGATRKMMPGTMMIIHNPQGSTDGDADAHDESSAMLKVVKNSLVDLLSNRTKQGKKKISEMMDACTAMDADEACKLGFCDEVLAGSPARNDFNPAKLVNICQRLSGSAAAVDGGKQKTNTQSMEKILKTLVTLGILKSADNVTEDVASAAIEAHVSNLIVKRDDLQAANTKHEDDRKARVTNRVTAAVDGKLIKPERKDALIAAGLSNEASLDFLGDLSTALSAPGPQKPRGAPPIPKGDNNQDGSELDTLRNGLIQNARCHAGEDPVEVAVRNASDARKARELRGHKNLFVSETLTK